MPISPIRRYHAMPLLKAHPNVIVTRSFSKGYSLAGIRLGYLVARSEIVAELIKVKDSYNCDKLSQVAGVAALRDQALPGGDAGQDRGDAKPTDGRAAVNGLHGPRQPVELRLGNRRPAGPGNLRAASRISKVLVRLMSYPRLSRGVADQRRDRRRDRPAVGNALGESSRADDDGFGLQSDGEPR